MVKTEKITVSDLFSELYASAFFLTVVFVRKLRYELLMFGGGDIPSGPFILLRELGGSKVDL